MKHFNIYYLNFSKVYDLNNLLDNFKTDEIIAETQTSFQSKNDTGIVTDILTSNHQKEYGEYSKFTEKIKVKHDKSNLVDNLIPLCEINPDLTTVAEGTLILVNDVKIEFYDDEEIQRIYSLFQKRIFEGVNIEGIDINNLISTVISDMSYFMKCKIDNETLVFKIPMENKSEFENKYTINDLLIGKLTIIGVYKGKIDENDFKRSTVYSALENEKNNDVNIDIIESSYETNEDLLSTENKNHFIDIFTIIQPINQKENVNQKNLEDNSKISLWSRIKKIFLGERKC